jgi:outer membrane protein assembly factor BamA
MRLSTRSVRVLASIALLLYAAAATARARAQNDEDERESPRVVKLDFRGNRSFTDDELEDAVATKSSGCKSLLVQVFCLFTKSPYFYRREYLDRTELRRDVLRLRVFYWQRGYRETAVDTAVARRGGGVAVTFTIRENAPTRVSSVRVRSVVDGPPVLTDREIERRMQLRAGEPLDLLALDSSIVLLRHALNQAGHADAVVQRETVLVDTARRTAAVRIAMDPRWLTRVGEIRVEGNERIGERSILNAIALKEGEIYRREEVLESQQRLYESNLFRHAAIVIPPRGDSVKLIEVTVREAPLNETRTSVGFNTVDFFQAEQRYTRYNFLGGARRLDLRLVGGNLLAEQLNGEAIFQDVLEGIDDAAERRDFLRPTWQASADFTNPWFLSPRNSYGVSVFAHHRTIAPIVIDRGFGASASFTREIARRTPLTINYRYELTRVQASDVYFCVNFGVCEVPTIAALKQRQALSPLAVSLFTDRTNDLFFPTDGYLARLDLEHASASTLSDFRHNRISGEGTKYWRVRRRGALAVRVRAGWVNSLESAAEGVRVVAGDAEQILHPRKRFYAGGSQSVRGYGENQLGPRVLTIAPEKLPEGALATCTTAGSADACSALLADVSSGDFQPRPTGGSALVEANVELRFPIWQSLGGAVFLDGAFVGQGALAEVTKGNGAITPGFGVRYYSPAGAIRVDLGIRPTLSERLGVVTEVEDEGGNRRIVPLVGTKLYDPLGGSRSGFRQVLDRLTLHLSIGQAF